MRKHLITLMLAFVSLILFAETVTTSEQNIVAKNFLQYHKQQKSIVNEYALTKTDSKATVYELDNDGFIVVSKDNTLPPVLAYSFTSNFPESERGKNPFFDIMEHDLNLRLEAYALGLATHNNDEKWDTLLAGIQRDRDFTQWPPENFTDTDGWVETRWNQSGIYQRFCPLDNSNERSVVGCVATALAQILHFHNYIGNPTFNNSDDYYSGYSYPYMAIDDDAEERDFPTFSELNNYLDSVVDHYENNIPLTNDDIAALNFACGVAVEMNYSSDGSGAQTSSIPQIVQNKFGYEPGYWHDYDPSFLSALAQSQQNMQPSEMSIYDANWGSGHAIICDGYNVDDYYHLNFGWGTSNSTCWYTLPQGMPNDYAIIGGASIGMEGGSTPFTLSGAIDVDVSPVGAHIILDGPYRYEVDVEDNTGIFSLPLFVEGEYEVTASLDRVYYANYTTTITESTPLLIELGNFEAVTGVINSDFDVSNAQVNFYQEDEIVYSGIVDENNTFSIPDVLPGTYYGTVSYPGGYFASQIFDISLENQNIDFDMEHLEGDLNIGFAGKKQSTVEYPLDVAFGIQINGNEYQTEEENLISGVRFYAPCDNGDDIQLFAQLWNGTSLVVEKEITDFSYDSLVDIEFDQYYLIQAEQEYYLGYKLVGDCPSIVFQDGRENSSGKGAFIKTGTWLNIDQTNYCIEAKVLTKEFGTITGNVDLQNLNSESVTIFAGNSRIELDDNGNFTADLKPGNYTLTIVSPSSETLAYENIAVTLNEINELGTLALGTGNATPEITSFHSKAYPNPFNLNQTRNGLTIRYTLPIASNVNVSIYNLKGQFVKQLYSGHQKNGQHSLNWNGKNNQNKSVSTGLYFYKIESNKKSITNRILILK